MNCDPAIRGKDDFALALLAKCAHHLGVEREGMEMSNRSHAGSKRSKSLAFAAAIAGTLSPAALMGQPVRWLLEDGGNGHWYAGVITGGISWTNARGHAGNLFVSGAQGHLATITSSVENDFVYQRVSSEPSLWHNSGGGFHIGPWLGAFQDRTAPDFSEPAGGWRWITDESLTFRPAIGWTNNAYGSGVDEDALKLINDLGSVPFDQWNDYPIDSYPNPGRAPPIAYVAEYGSLPALRRGLPAAVDWHAAANWLGGVPNGVNAWASVAAPAGSVNLFVNSPTTLGTLNFEGPNSVNLSGTGSLLLQTTSGQAEINSTSGSHNLVLPVTFASDAKIFVGPAPSNVLTLQDLRDSARDLRKTGDGVVVANRLVVRDLNVERGTVRLAGFPAAKVRALTVSEDGTFDLNGSGIVVDYLSASPLANVRQLILTGRIANTGAGTAIGYAENTDLQLNSFLEQPTDLTAVLVRATLRGDANLSGTVDISDFARLATNFNGPGNWFNGDFNYDGTVNISDFASLATNFNQSVGSAPAAMVALPEPAIVALLFVGPLVNRNRRPFSASSVTAV